MDWNTVYSEAPRITTGNSLYLNVLHGRLRYIKALLDRGIDVNSKNDFGENALVASLRIVNDSKRKKVFKFLLKRGADFHTKDNKHGRNALLWVCYFGRECELTILLHEASSELDLKEKDKHGSTALHYATKSNSPSMVIALVEMCNHIRESVDIADGQGFTPYILARRLGHREVANILEKLGHASPAQFDSTSFRTCREWSQYGKWERKTEARTRERKQRAMDKIRGDYTYKCGSDSSSKSSEHLSESSKASHPEITAYSDNDRQRPTDKVDLHHKLRKGSKAAMSLVEMTSLYRGHLVRSYRQTEFDTSKSMEQSSHLFRNLNSFLDVLAEQKSTSFRKSVTEQPKQVNISHIEKPKVSSLAIIMGKRRYGGKSPRVKRKPLTMRNKAAHISCEDSVKKSKLVTTLPQIHMNNKVL